MFSTILVASDLSEASSKVIGCLHGLQSLGTRQVILLHALGIKYLDDLKYQLRPLVEPFLERQKRMLEGQGFEVAIEIAPGLPQFEINRVAVERQVALIVVGSHGASLAKQTLLGSVAVETLHGARVPVLVVRLKITLDDGASRCEVLCRDFRGHLLHPTDFSDAAERAFGYVEKIVESGAKSVTLLHVQDRGKIGKHLESRLAEFNQIDQARLDRLQARLEDKGATEVQALLAYGSPVQEILRVAGQKEYSLLVMGSQGHGIIPEIFLGSVSHNVVRHASAAVLLVPAVGKLATDATIGATNPATQQSLG